MCQSDYKPDYAKFDTLQLNCSPDIRRQFVLNLTENNMVGLPHTTFPGCYEIFYLDKENDILCATCATKILFDNSEPQIITNECTGNIDPDDIKCMICGKVICEKEEEMQEYEEEEN